MSIKSFIIKNVLRISPSITAADAAGELRVDSSDSNKLKFHDGSTEESLATEDYADLAASTAADDVLPDQTGNSGKYLQTDGSDPSWQTVTAGANTALSNLASVALNVDLAGSVNIGSPATPLLAGCFTTMSANTGGNTIINITSATTTTPSGATVSGSIQPAYNNGFAIYGASGAGSTKPFYFETGNGTSGSSGLINIKTGDVGTAGDTGAATLATGSTASGSSGDLNLTVGSATATQGAFKFLKTGAPSSNGQVWTASSTDGTGYWANPAAGGANTALSNLASVAVNTSILPGSTNTINLGASNKRWVTAYGNNFDGKSADSAYVYIESGDGDYVELTTTDTPLNPNSTTSYVNAIDGEGNFAILTDGDNQSIEIYTNGYGGGTSGPIYIHSGDATGDSGDLYLATGEASGARGKIWLQDWMKVEITQDVTNTFGPNVPAIVIDVNSADVLAGYGGGLIFNGNSDEGAVVIATRDGDSDGSTSTGQIYVVTGQGEASTAQPSGDLYLQTGAAYTTGNTGTIFLETGTTPSGTRGEIRFASSRMDITAGFLQLWTQGSDPAGAAKGDLYFNTGTNKIKVYNGATWETVTSV